MTAVRRGIEFLLTRVLRSRIGLAAGIAVLVLGVVGAARLVAGRGDPTAGLSNRPTQPITTVDPTAGDDGALSTTSTPSPVTRPGEATPEQVAERFATAWLGRPGLTAEDWHAGLSSFSTATLSDKLTGADPGGVPASEVTDEVVVQARSEVFVEVLIPLDTGQLRLELVAPDGRWLVDAVDWEQG
ncbi:hypothetical protein Vqi01_33720 [Micromonospora qiuiae]|uniref:DUF4878 domain-containing protein n=1 Tax=Micromonospora qiuiae TaxID=502268 RepID=A0ABQ4JDG6_9ACTN|nr:hypothetical protein [Micromonospora qiuiae]GIJ28210.1 hypothetical protein Vqi01_33720 [Micromonospora qiuiae]